MAVYRFKAKAKEKHRENSQVDPKTTVLPKTAFWKKRTHSVVSNILAVFGLEDHFRDIVKLLFIRLGNVAIDTESV